jgi:hypothetical protein
MTYIQGSRVRATPAALYHGPLFEYHPTMRLDMNPRGNGACPLCVRDANCKLKRLLSASLEGEPDVSDMGMEIVIYACPLFAEKVRP